MVIIIGGGKESLKRIRSILKEKCQILVISQTINNQIKTLVKNKKVQFKKQKVDNPDILSFYKPDMIITTTNDRELNEKIINYAKKRKIIAYSSDNPELSDFANPAIIDLENIVQIAIFTGGKSPAMSKKLRIEFEKIFKKVITKEDIDQIKIQNIAREYAKKMILNQHERKMYLHSIIKNKAIKLLIKNGKLKEAEKQAIMILREWK